MSTRFSRIEKIGVASCALLVIALLACFFIFSSQAPQAQASGQSLACVDSSQFIASTSPGYNMGCAAVATTTSQVFFGVGLTPSATTTMETVYTPIATSLDINVWRLATTGATAIINYGTYVSNDGINFYPLGTGFVTATSSNIHIANYQEKYFQLRMSGAIASSSAYTQVILQNQTPN